MHRSQRRSAATAQPSAVAVRSDTQPLGRSPRATRIPPYSAARPVVGGTLSIAQAERQAAAVARQIDPAGQPEKTPGHSAPAPSALAALVPAQGGRPLDRALRDDLGQYVGGDVGDVRLHTGPAAHALARSVGAQAYTVGRDIVFGAGRFAPATAPGRALLAHELTHVAQQTASGRPQMQRQAGEEAATPKPLRLVFYQGKDKDSGSFQAHADTIAAALGAVRLDYADCDDKGAGAISCAREESVLHRAAAYAKCLGQKIDQLHVVGHVYGSSGPACLSGIMTKELADAFEPTAKVVVHGCKGTARYRIGASTILKHLPQASVYLHGASAEAGGPLDFHKVTADAASTDPKTISVAVQNAVAEEIGFTKSNVAAWAKAQLAGLKAVAGKAEQSPDDKKHLQIVKEWLTLPAFRSAETGVFADAVLADQSGQVPQGIKAAAAAFKAAAGD